MEDIAGKLLNIQPFEMLCLEWVLLITLNSAAFDPDNNVFYWLVYSHCIYVDTWCDPVSLVKGNRKGSQFFKAVLEQ